jgi:DHA2 family multidrug resistance protein-like MFS transporter
MTTDMIVGTVPPERAGIAAGMSETSTEFGGALGIAVLGSIVTAIYRGAMSDAVPAGVPDAAAAAARDTLGGALAVAGDLPPGLGADLVGHARAAFAQAFELTCLLCAVLALAAAVLAAVTLRRRGSRPGLEVRPELASPAMPAAASGTLGMTPPGRSITWQTTR